MAPVIGEICHNRHRSSLVVREGKTSSIVELFRLMRNNVQFMLPNENNNVVLLTSSVSGEGKSFVSLNLAASFALLGKKTVLVGMDVRAPKLAEYLSLKPTPGVTSFLSKSDVALAEISTQDELEAIAVAPVIGEICHNRHRSSLVVREGKTSSIVELFRLMRNNVQFMLPNENNNVVLLTSSVSGEGKSFVSLNLAASFALLGKKTVLVGMDVRAPKLAEYLSMKPTPGVTSFLSKQDVTLAEITQQCKEVDNLDVIVSGPIPPNPSELLLSKRVKQLIGELREKYDCIIIDSAPMAMVSDTFSLLQFADNVVYVSRANYTKRSYIKYLNGIIERGQVKNVSLVLNDSNPKLSAGYGYGYGSSEED